MGIVRPSYAALIRRLSLGAVGWVIVVSALLAAPRGVKAQNLVQNPGFEDSTSSTSSPGWMINTGSYNYFAGPDSGFTPYSGNWAVVFGAEDSNTANTEALSQTIATVPMTTYIVSFFLANLDGPTNQFTATFDGQTVLSLTDASSFAFTQYSASIVATSSQSTLQFVGEQVPSYFVLDDVSVEAAPMPIAGSGLPSLFAGLVCLVAIIRRKRRRVADKAD